MVPHYLIGTPIVPNRWKIDNFLLGIASSVTEKGGDVEKYSVANSARCVVCWVGR